MDSSYSVSILLRLCYFCLRCYIDSLRLSLILEILSLSHRLPRHHDLDFALPGPFALDELGIADDAHVVDLHVLDRRVA